LEVRTSRRITDRSGVDDVITNFLTRGELWHKNAPTQVGQLRRSSWPTDALRSLSLCLESRRIGISSKSVRPVHEQATSEVTGTLQSQLAFTRHNFDDQQGIIRQLDSKAGVFITLLVFLANGALIMARDASPRLRWSGTGALASWLYLGSFVLFLLGFLVTAWCVQKVIRPRALTSLASGLVFARDVLGHGSPVNYHKAMESSTEEALLKDLTIQVFNLCVIVQRKTNALHLAWWPTMVCFVAWAINAILAVCVLSQHQ
jgi:hypothetical protein